MKLLWTLKFISLRHSWPKPYLAIMFISFGCLARKDLLHSWLKPYLAIMFILFGCLARKDLLHSWPKPYLAIMFISFGCLARIWQSCLYLSVILLGRTLYIIWLSGLLTLSILFEGYSRNESCTLNYVFRFLFLERCLFKIILL